MLLKDPTIFSMLLFYSTDLYADRKFHATGDDVNLKCDASKHTQSSNIDHLSLFDEYNRIHISPNENSNSTYASFILYNVSAHHHIEVIECNAILKNGSSILIDVVELKVGGNVEKNDNSI